MGFKFGARSFQLLLLLFTFLSVSGIEAGSKKWVNSFVPVQQFFVSPTGSGPGTQASPMSLAAAINNAKPGDLYWFTAGTYSGLVVFSRNGTADHPIVFRALPGAHVKINGGVDIIGDYNWVWGFEITDPGFIAATDSGLRLLATGAHAINNVIHHHPGKNGMGDWSTGPGHVVYGNIIYENGHNIYAQNDFSSNGYKYIVNNLLLDSELQCHNCFNLHGYSQNGMVTGFYVQSNIFENGRTLIGGYNVPADREIVKKNYFYQSRAQFGWSRPSQAKFKKNYMVGSTLIIQRFWGEGEKVWNQVKPNSFSGNEMYSPSDNHHIYFVTTAYLTPTEKCDGCPAIKTNDTFDDNKYSAPFMATFFANNTNLGDVNMTEWRSATRNAGNPFDVNSKEVPVPTVNKIVVLKNEYDSTRAHVAIFNWEASSSVMLNLSSFVKSGSSIKVLDPHNVFGTPVFSGTYSGPVSVPVGGAAFKSFLVQVQ